MPPGATGTWEVVPAVPLIQNAAFDNTVSLGTYNSKATAAIKNARVPQVIRSSGTQPPLRDPGCACPACPATRRRKKPNDASSRLTFRRPEIVEVDPDFLTYPTTAGYKCASVRSEKADPQDNVWRSHQVRTYLGPTEGGDERKLEIFLAMADALRKARELQMELGTPRAKLKFPIVWTPSRAFIFLPRANQKKAGVGDACYNDYHFEFTPKRVLIMRRATATGTIGNRFAIFSHMPIRPDAVPIFDVSSLGKPIIRPAGNAIHMG